MNFNYSDIQLKQMAVQIAVINNFLDYSGIPHNQWFSQDAAEIISYHLFSGDVLGYAVVVTVTGQPPRTHARQFHPHLLFLFNNYAYTSYCSPTIDMAYIYEVQQYMVYPYILQHIHIFTPAQLLVVVYYFLNFMNYNYLLYVIGLRWDFPSMQTTDLYLLATVYNRVLSMKLDTKSPQVGYYIYKALQPAHELLLREQQPPRVPFFASCKKQQASYYYSCHFEEYALLPPARHAQFDKLREIVRKNSSGEYNAFEYCGLASLGEIYIMLRYEPFRHVDSKNMVVYINRDRILVDYMSFINAVAGNYSSESYETDQNGTANMEPILLPVYNSNTLESAYRVSNITGNPGSEELSIIPPARVSVSAPAHEESKLYAPELQVSDAVAAATAEAAISGAAARQDFRVKFEGEKGADGGGLKNEFIYSSIQEIFKSDYCMFATYDNGTVWLDNFTLLEEDDIIRYYTYFGILAGVAVLNGICIGDRLTKLFYKILLSQEADLHEKVTLSKLSDLYKVTYDDVAELDKYLVDGLLGLRTLRGYNVQIEELEMTFSVSAERLECMFTKDLIENGRNIIVTNENLEQYIYERLKFEIFHYMDAINCIRKGFTQVIPQFKYRNILPFYMQQILGGKPASDLTQLEQITKYNEPFSAQHPTIRMFWKVVHALPQTEKENFLLFVFSSHRIPVNGFTRFTIECSGDMVHGYPVAHTCGNVLCIPQYYSESILVERLLFSIKNYMGFGIV